MEVVVLEKNKKTAKSLKRCISIKYQCSIEENFDIEILEAKYKGSEAIFLIDECILDPGGKNINKEGLKLAHWIIERLHLKAIVFGIEDKKETGIPYLKVPFCLDDLFDEISKSIGGEKSIDKDLLLDKYEHFRSKISHDYLQYAAKNKGFYEFLLVNFYKYTYLIFGINLDEEKSIEQGGIDKVIGKLEKQNDSSSLHDLMRKLKLYKIKKIRTKDWPEMTGLFFKNLEILIEALNTDKTPADLEERIAENFFLSWYLWRKLFFLEKYNRHFSDGFYRGCFRVLLSYNRPYYQKVKKNTLVEIFGSPDISASIERIKYEAKKMREIFKLK
ncbi:MAG: hypothetical protein PVH61_10595 [Candidatus Aminicenantes bacterium]|jgi:hypothetical protein